MEASPLARKLRIKAGDRVLLPRPPERFRASLEPLPERIVLRETEAPLDDESYDVVHAFAWDRAALDALTPLALGAPLPAKGV